MPKKEDGRKRQGNLNFDAMHFYNFECCNARKMVAEQRGVCGRERICVELK
jgi:hypothetical protein